MLVEPLLRDVPRYMWAKESDAEEKRTVVCLAEPLDSPVGRTVVGHFRIGLRERAPVG